jgi:NFU1 iron-sulfur cluster scaffold homolog, mitochondrial
MYTKNFSPIMFRHILRRSLFIQTEQTPNQNALKFKLGKPIVQQPLEFLKPSLQAPITLDLFKIDGVESVMFNIDSVTVVKKPESEWQLIKPDIFSLLMDTEIVIKHQQEQSISSCETTEMIKELLDTRIRPSIQDDGGDVEFVSFKNNIVTVKLKGACKTCDSSTLTLKNGIENMLMHYVPEIESVEQLVEEVDEISRSEFEKMELELKNKT